MHVAPYSAVTGVPFGATDDFVAAFIGAAGESSVDYLGRRELCFGSRIFRFSAQTGLFVEATLRAEYYQIEECALLGAKKSEVAFAELGFTVAKLDADSFAHVGFVVSPRFGIAFDPHHAPYLTVFDRSELPRWRKIHA